MAYLQTMRSATMKQTMQDSRTPPPENEGKPSDEGKEKGFLLRIIRAALPRKKNEETLREVLEGVIEGLNDDTLTTIAPHERTIIGNILKLRSLTVVDVMIPRANITALEIGTPQQDVLTFVAEKRFSRYPIYRETLDDVAGTVHIKDILTAIAGGKPFALKDIVRDALIVSPALPVMDLLLQMRHSGKHIVMVVDEYGGIDGLATIGDIVQSIIGEIGDERDPDLPPDMIEKPDGILVADARTPIEDFEERYGNVFSNAEDECDTLGGLVVALAGRVPGRGEVISHKSGIVFEVLEADPRRVRRLKIRNIPQRNPTPEGSLTP